MAMVGEAEISGPAVVVLAADEGIELLAVARLRDLHARQHPQNGKFAVTVMRCAVPRIIERRTGGDNIRAETVVTKIILDLLHTTFGEERIDRVNEGMKSLRAQARRNADERVFADAHVVNARRKLFLEGHEQEMADVAQDNDHFFILHRQFRRCVLELLSHAASSSFIKNSNSSGLGDFRCHSKTLLASVGQPQPLIVCATMALTVSAGLTSAAFNASKSWPSTSRVSQQNALKRSAGFGICSERTWDRLKSSITVRLFNFRFAATIIDSQTDPSLASPSPMSVTTRRGDFAILNASAMPTATPMPWPSEPVETSTPGTFSRSGW